MIEYCCRSMFWPALIKGLGITVASGIGLRNAVTNTVSCIKIQYTWNLADTTAASHQKNVYGYKYHITDVKFSRKNNNCYEGYVPKDWKTQSLAANFTMKYSHTEESGQASSVISIELPQGWKIQKREQTQRADNKPLVLASLNPSYPVYDIYDKNHVLVGAVGYSTYEPYEGDRDSVQIVYSALRLGSVYRFDTDNKYDVIQTTERGTTALTTVIFQDGANSEPVNNLGVLAYDNEKECFVAIELEASSVSESQALEIAKSIRF